MNVSEFSADTFDPKDWINNVYRKADEEAKNDNFTDSLIWSLQQCILEVNKSIEESTQKAYVNIPQLMKEVREVKEELHEVDSELDLVREETVAVQNSSSQPILLLGNIHDVKIELEKAKEALREADNWMVLASDIEDVFITGDIENIAEKLVSMQQSLGVFSYLEDCDDRRIQLEGFKNRLEAIVSPKIAHCFIVSDTDEAKKLFRVFSSIERLPQLLRYYVKCQKGYLCQHWKTFVDSDQDSSEMIHMFYEHMLNNWKTQLKWCTEVFPTVNMTLQYLQLYADVLMTLEPTVDQCIEVLLKQNSQPLLILLICHQNSVDFENQLRSLLSTEEQNSPEWELLLKSLYHPYVQYASKYGILERHLLDELLWSSNCLSTQLDDLADTIHNIGQTVPVIIQLATDAKQRCLQFTHGCSFPGLFEALDGSFLKYLERYRKAANELKQKANEAEDWDLFHMCLSFLQTTGELLRNIKNFDLTLVHDVTNSKRQQDADYYIKIMLTADAEKQYKELLAAVLNGTRMSVLDGVVDTVEKLSQSIYSTTCENVMKPIIAHFADIEHYWTKLKKQENVELPKYGYSPQEYITQIGEYLLTLPQHLEPFFMRDNIGLVCALNAADSANYKSILYARQNEDSGYAHAFLTEIAHSICQVYLEQILKLRGMNSICCKQLAVDIEYLGNVLDELGVGLNKPLTYAVPLLRLSVEEFDAKCAQYPLDLERNIRSIRDIA